MCKLNINKTVEIEFSQSREKTMEISWTAFQV